MAATPSPLPIPAQTAPENPLAQALTALSRAVPNIDPEVATAVAQTAPSPGEAVNTGQAAQGYVEAVNTANYLKQQNSTNQLAAWNQLSANEQKMVKGAGYSPPHPHRSFWGTVTGDIGGAVHDTLNAAGAPLRAVQHGIRSAFAIVNQPGDPMSGSLDLGRFLSPGEWAHAWNQTSNGEHYILPQVQRQVLDKYGQQTYDLAMKLATGGNATQIVSAAPPAQQQQLAQQLMGDPKLHQALQELDAGHVSEGRMLAYRVLGLKAGSTAGNLLSGATDATIDWFGDPVVVGLKGAKVAGTSRYLVQNGEDVQRIYQNNGAVRAAFSDIASKVQAKDYAGLAESYPKLTPMFDSIREWNPTTADDVANMFADEANVRSIVAGNAASLPGGVEGGILPHLNYTGLARLKVKGQLEKVIDFAADRPATIEGLQPGDTIDHPISAQGLGPATRIITAGGQLVRKLTTLTPTGSEFNANDPNWFAKLHDIAMMALPKARANQLLNEYATEATLGGRKMIYAGLLKEVMAAMGIDRIPGVTDWAEAVTNPDAAEGIISHQAYAPGGMDQVWREGNQRPAGILKSDLTDIWKMPNFKELYTQSKKLGVMRAVNGSLNNQMVDKFMNQAWKPMALARFGFSVRVAGEEAFGMLLRANPTAYLQAGAARSMLRQEALAENPELHGHLASTWGWLTAHLPAAARDRIKTPTDLAVEHLGDATSRAMAKVSGALAGSKYRDAVRLLAENGVMDPDGAFGRYASASESHGGNFYDQAMSEIRTKKVWAHGKWVSARMSPTGAFTEYTPTATLYTNNWYKRLHALASDPWARVALEQRAAAPVDRLQAVADALKADPAWTRAERSLVTTDGRYVGPEATTDEAANDHAKAIIDLADALTQHPNGEVPGLVDHLLANRKPPTVAALDLIPEDERPAAVTGPEMVPMLDGFTGAYTKGVNRMFHVIGKQIDWISRQPMFIHNFAVSLDAYKPLVKTWEQLYGPRALTEVVDGGGKPLRVYHGTQDTFESFDPSLGPKLNKDERGAAAYFTSDPSYANLYSVGFPGERLPKGAAPQTRMAYLDIRNPVRLGESAGAFTQKQIEAWKAAGHDGVIYTEAGKPAYAVFNPRQIKDSPDSLITQSSKNIDQMLVTAATDRALKLTLPYIHNPELRSQFEVIGRNVAPFMFAQEQFYKRWARTAAFSPWAFRQAQLINQGVYHSGFTHTDPTTGQQYFVYPGAGAVQDVLAKSLGVFGYQAFLPIEANLRGQVKMASPGLERLGLPNLGPAVVVPLHVINSIFPETRGPSQAIEGQQTASQSYISSLVPATVSRIWQDFTATPNNSQQYASAMMQAIQYLEASGHGIGQTAVNDLGAYNGLGAPPEDKAVSPGDYITDRAGKIWVVQADGQWRRNDPAALASYMQRVKNWTRVFLITRTIFGFNVPASPENLFDPNHVNEDFQALLKSGLPYNEAVATFMKLHPDASAYTVFQTKNQAGAPLPATAAAMQFMDANSAFFKDHPLAGAFFIPTADSSGKFDQQAYTNQLQEQLRVRRTPTEFWQEIAYTNAATPYFNGENMKNRMLDSGYQNRTAIDQKWTAESQQYMKANPLFAQQLAQTGGTYTRSDIENDLANALNDPRLPETPQTEDIRQLFNGWIMYRTMTAPYSSPGGGTMPSAQRYQLEVQFANEAQQFVAAHPDTLPVFQRLMQPELSAALSQTAAVGA